MCEPRYFNFFIVKKDILIFSIQHLVCASHVIETVDVMTANRVDVSALTR